MSPATRIAREEWRLWLRSRVVIAAALIIAALLAATSVLTINRIAEEQAQRTKQQVAAEETFFAQPDRHPHRMVHYGHYAFRPPPPLAVFEPGVDAVTGQSIFVEGHRQNTAMFADTKAAADLGGFAALTPASLYKFLLPLLLIVLGHAMFLRERESGTLAVLLAQGSSGSRLARGKAMALFSIIAIFTIPLLVVAAYSVALGESVLAAASLVASYFLYLCAWGAIVLGASILIRQRAISLGGAGVRLAMCATRWTRRSRSILAVRSIVRVPPPVFRPLSSRSARTAAARSRMSTPSSPA